MQYTHAYTHKHTYIKIYTYEAHRKATSDDTQQVRCCFPGTIIRVLYGLWMSSTLRLRSNLCICLTWCSMHHHTRSILILTSSWICSTELTNVNGLCLILLHAFFLFRGFSRTWLFGYEWKLCKEKFLHFHNIYFAIFLLYFRQPVLNPNT